MNADYARRASDSHLADEIFIRCEGLVKIYKVANLEVLALQGLDLIVRRGEMLGVVGASGSGKSTLMNILGGLDRPSAGQVWVGGNDLLKMSYEAINHYRRTQIGFVWQQGARNLIPYLTALENVRLPVTITARSWSREKQHAEALLDAVGLSERKHHRLSELSGGEQQRVAIAVALANNPSLLLADEPTGEVDTATAAGIYQILKDLNEQYGLTTVIVSHDTSIAQHVDRVVAIRDGKTSSETVRQSIVQNESAADRTGLVKNERNGESQHQTEANEAFEEVVLLDSAGRLQIPREYLEQFDIQGRVLLEPVPGDSDHPGGILIRKARSSSSTPTLPTPPDETVPESSTHGHGYSSSVRGWWKHVRRGGKGLS